MKAIAVGGEIHANVEEGGPVLRCVCLGSTQEKGTSAFTYEVTIDQDVTVWDIKTVMSF
jgi:hypothetical protein